MNSRATLARISGLIKAKRRENGMGLREAAQASGISPSTLSRLERGASSSLPDTETLTNLAAWLDMPLTTVLNTQDIENENAPKMKTPDKVQVYLRADKDLKPETAEALNTMFRLLYEELTRRQNKTR